MLLPWGNDGSRMQCGKTTSWWKVLWGFGQHFAGWKYWDLSFMWKRCQVSLTTSLKTKSTPLWQWYWYDSNGSFQQDNIPCYTTHVQIWFQTPENSRCKSQWDLMRCWINNFVPFKTSKCNLQQLNILLLTSWHQIPKEQFEALKSLCLFCGHV